MTDVTCNGIILKGVGGFYYVRAENGEVYECRAKGKFRKNETVPLAGDRVEICLRDCAENTIEKIYIRKNCLKRPPVANIDQLMIVCSCVDPAPNTLVIDKLTVLAQKSGIAPVIVITKSDLAPCDELLDIYSKTGYKVLVSDGSERFTSLFKAALSSRLTALTGNSGVGKSTLINLIAPELKLKTGTVSTKLGRGRHTTRQAEIFSLGFGDIIDTAGFSSLELSGGDVILKEDLMYYFPEFEPALNKCRFASCLHVGEKGCRVAELVKSGEISQSRYNSYLSMVNAVKDVKSWQL